MAGSGEFSLGATLRSLRRSADLSQRDLAARAGVPVSTLARIESGATRDPGFRTVRQLVLAAGAQLAVHTAGGGASAEASPELPGRHPDHPDEELRDEAGRHYPAHLDVRPVVTADDWRGAWWAHWYTLPPERWPVRVPEHTYDLDRGERDRRRRRAAVAAAVVVREVPGLPADAWQWVAETAPGEVVGEVRAHLRAPVPSEIPDGGREAVLDGIVVAPHCRGAGIGGRLLAALTARLRDTGVGSLRALTELGMADGFLVARGFRPEAARPVRWTLALR